MMDELKSEILGKLVDRISAPRGFPEQVFESILEGMKKQARRF
jgi:hypothetical protein